MGGGLDLVVFEGNVQKSDGARVAAEAECENKDDGAELGQEGHEADSDDVTSGEDSDDPTYLPSNEEENSVEDIHFTDSDEVYDYESGFGEDNAKPKDCNAEKGKKVVTSDLDDEDAVDSDELEQDHVIVGDGSGADDGEDATEDEGQSFPVHKTQKDMENYQWKVGTLYESRQEFKDTVAAYAVHTARNVKFKKCDLVRVWAVCQQGCPFWLYAAKVGEESTWQLRSMNLQHTCMQTHRVGIMHSKWLGSQFKKKVEENPKIKVKELVARDQRKWNLTSWEKEIKSLRAANEGAFRHLNAIPPRFWSRSKFTFLSKCDSLVNNMSESFNAVLIEAREKPIVTMLEDIRVYMMTRWVANRERVLNYPGNIMPMIRKKLEKQASLARDWRPYWSSSSKYEVMCGLDKYVVDLVAAECSCRKWQMSGIPCPHAISCITFKGLNLESYVDDCYKKEAYMRCYQEVIHPVNGPELWERTQYDDVIPPSYRRPSHRLVKKRKRGAADEDRPSQTHISWRGQVQRCSNCGRVGHKKSGCSQPKKRFREGERRIPHHQEPMCQHLSTGKLPTRPKNPQARPTTEAPQPKKVSTQPNILARTKNKAASTATSTSNKQPLSQSSVRKRQFSNNQCSAPHVPLQKLRMMAKLPPSQWKNL
ncbi:hypothetical protein Ahy_A03g014430 [Arachis hypogaea]|uniref:SWIM-type domain-containing protein n=1 Tax=Arachis hypogaea TaxID=3818 RepID=A0A445DXQ6_ARAHY|nr:hypothetical protein Ahy_A03g014430 [Arachis hypogaea]